jgi:SAM-dependent methyltransferase
MRAAEAFLSSAFDAFKAGNFQMSVRALKQAFDAEPEFQQREATQYIASFPANEKRHFWTAPPELLLNSTNLQETFGTIYNKGIWGGGSGAGSDLRNTVMYVAYVQHLMERHAVTSVVDIGCGDWRFSQYLNFDDRRYLGVDIVGSVISNNSSLYERDNIKFKVADATEFEIPQCDLLLCKDVLQHLSNSNVSKILARCTVATRTLVTNDYYPSNEDCKNGDTRPLNITAAPFNLLAVTRLAFLGKITFLLTTPNLTDQSIP